jgi:molecular chaperone GrpE
MKDKEKETGKAPEKEEAKDEEKENLEGELEEAKKEAAEWKNKYYTAYADLDNLRKSLEKDHADALRYRAEGFLEGLIPALDSFHIALSATPKSEESRNYQQGFVYIYKQIMDALASEGVTEILPKEGDEFDPQRMHALEAVETDGEPNKVVKVMTKGYMLKDRLIRPAMVSVSKKKEAGSKESQDAAGPEEGQAADSEEANKA